MSYSDDVTQRFEEGAHIEDIDGWSSLVESLNSTLSEADSEYSIQELYCDNGKLVFNATPSVDDDELIQYMDGHIIDTERASMMTCEECGAYGDLYANLEPHHTLCPEHYRLLTHGDDR